MANTLKIKRGAAASIPTGQLAEPLFTSDTYDLYIGTGASNQRFQKYIASGTSSQFLKGDGSLDSTSYQEAITLTTSGSSGASTFISNTLNIPTYSLSGLGGEPAITPGTTSQYWRGDKSFQTLDTSVVPENGPVYFTEPRVRATVLTGLNLSGGGTIAATDSVLTAFGKIQNQISALVGGATYQGTWNASSNTPTLASGTGTKGYYYVVSVAGSTNLDGITDWKIGDWAIFNGTTWDKVDNTDAVSSVNGFTGAVNLGLDNISDVDFSGSPTNTQLLRFNGTSSKWENWTPTYISAAITSLNGLTGATQTFATGTTGTDFGISSSSGVHTFNIPSASTTARGLVTTDTQSFAGNKTFTGAGGQSTPILIVTGSSNDNYNFLQSNLSPSLGAGKNTIILIGKSSSAVNAGYMAFNWNSAGGTDNYLHFGLYDVNNVLRIYGSGNVTIATGDSGNHRLNVGGSIYSSSQITSEVSNSTGVGGIVFIKNSAAAAIGNKAVLAFATDNDGTISNHPKIQAITTNNSNGASGLEFYTHEGSGNINKVLTLASDKSATFTGVLYGTSATFSSAVAGYAMSITNVEDSSQGLLLRATDADTTLYLARFQSSASATSQTWVDRFILAKSGNAILGDGIPYANVRFYIKAENQSAASYALYIEDGSGQDVAWFRNDKVSKFFGNVGIGVTPSSILSGYIALQVGSSSSLTSTSSGIGSFYFANNAFLNTSGSWQRINTGFASDYYQENGKHAWRTAASGNAGTTFTYSQVMTLDASGNLGIGTSSINAKLEVAGAVMVSGADAVAVANRGALDFSSGNTRLLSFGANTSTQGGFQFLTLASNGTGIAAMTITNSGSVLANNPSEGATGEGLIAGRSFKIDATGSGQTAKMYVVSNTLSDTYGSGLQIQFANLADTNGFGYNLNTSGNYETYVKDSTWKRAMTITKDRYLRLETKGIQFNGDTADANSLDDYEEGSWTPAFSDAGTPSYTTQFGRYTKIGRVVFCTIALRATSVSGSSTIVLTGLPFSAADYGDTGQRHTYSPRLGGHINGLSEATAKFRINGTTMTGVKGDTSTTYMTAAQFTSGSPEVTGDFWYYV